MDVEGMVWGCEGVDLFGVGGGGAIVVLVMTVWWRFCFGWAVVERWLGEARRVGIGRCA